MDEIPTIDIPDSLLTKLWDATGTAQGGNKGFFLFYVNKEGIPNCVARPQDMATRLALISIINDYRNIIKNEEEEDDQES